jgi:transcriptional regulator with XRE-family HTH domain
LTYAGLRGTLGVEVRVMEIGARLRRMREMAGISRPVLARAAGVGESYLAALEKGRFTDPRVATFTRVVMAMSKLTGRPWMEVLEHLIQDALADTNAPAGGGVGEEVWDEPTSV